MQTHNLGYPRIGSQRELKKASEQYWAGKLPADQLASVGKTILKTRNWLETKAALLAMVEAAGELRKTVFSHG
jgi:5-methyltetrahydropteroyltriglutamate--homocysteine methyltransferase